MKKNLLTTISIALLAITAGLSSCNDFLSVVPKGQKIPTTLADFDALLRDEYGNQRTNVTQAILLLNDKFESASNLSYYQLYSANYNWDENADRIAFNHSDEGTYYNGYAAISTSNLIIEHAAEATEASEADKAQLIAQAKILRATNYFVLANYYADTYEEVSAASKLSVPLITSADIDAPYVQVSIKELYDFMLKDIEEAIPNLRPAGATILHANLGAAYALSARIHLQMGHFDKALSAANEALKQNDKLYDWTQFYTQYKTQIEQVNVYTNAPSPMGYDYVENYNFRHGVSIYRSNESNIRTDRATRFEPGDAKFASRWKIRTVGADTYYKSITNGFFNYGGLTTTEVYLIKAECLARQGDVTGAMNILNTVRKKRILPTVYADLTAATKQDAIRLINRTKGNELILSITPFADRRRLNKEEDYAQTLSKTENGKNLSLSPASHMWTMPFPQGAIKNHGNGSIQQNVSK
ncbi:RagB/SusD family nutrient uptake outer membrane protein [Solitalea canadensis]|nr:RagB/SusD family nutrient uptake outer membrane protein [Solitalea canadensis]